MCNSKCIDNPQYLNSNTSVARDTSSIYWATSSLVLLSTGPYYKVPALSIRKHTYLLPIEDSVPGQPYILQEGQGGTKRKFHLEDNLEVRVWATHQEDDPKAEADGERESEGQVHKPYHTLTPYSGLYISGTVFEKGDTV
jgi:hypothetical protein